jgi:hypothetical protein
MTQVPLQRRALAPRSPRCRRQCSPTVRLSKIALECLICGTPAGPRPMASRARAALFSDGVSQNMRQRSVSPTGSRAQQSAVAVCQSRMAQVQVWVIIWGVRSRVMMVRLGRAGRRGKEYTGGRGFRSARPCASAGYARRPVAAARCWPGGSEVESVEANFWVILPCSPACRGTCSAKSAVALVRVTQPGASSRRSPSRDGSRRGDVMDKAGGIER